MKRIFASILILVALLALTPGVAFAGSALDLVEVRNDDGGPTFVFRVTGEFSRSELESGFVQVEGGDSYPLYCQQTDATTVICHTTQKVGGTHVVVGFGGSIFWHKVPEHRSSISYCYPAYDWNDKTEPTGWDNFDTICQDSPAQDGDSVNLYNPLFDDSFDYYYFPETGGACGWADPGQGYYYPDCPEENPS